MCELHITVFKDGMPSSVRLTIRQWTGRSTERLTQFTSDTSGRASLWISPSSTAELIVDRGEAGERVFSLPDCPADSSAELRIDL
jgi:hypothetical protein